MIKYTDDGWDEGWLLSGGDPSELGQYTEASVGCPELEKEVEALLDDPITDHYGVGSEMMPLVIANHRKRHGCKEEE